MFGHPPTYAYNTQVHRSTITSPFSLVLSRHPPGPTMLPEMGVLHTDVSRETTVQATHLSLQERIKALHARADRHARASEHRYKRNHDKLVRIVQTFAPVDMVFIDRSQLPLQRQPPHTRSRTKHKTGYFLEHLDHFA